MKKILFWLTALIILVAVNFSIIKETTLAQGQTMLLQFAPVDPRSLM